MTFLSKLYRGKKLPSPEHLFFYFFFGVLSFSILTSSFKLGWTREPLSGNADFLCLYTAAHILQNYPPALLYDLETQKIVQQQFLKNGVIFHGGVMLYVHPPFEALWFYPFSWLTYNNAYWVWFGLNLASLIFLPLVLRRISSIQSPPSLLIVLLAMASFLPFSICLYRGQDSILFLWIILAAFLFFKKDRDWAGGFVLGLAFFRFHIVYLIAFPLIIKMRKKAILGLSSCLGMLFFISVLIIGLEGLKRYYFLLRAFNQPEFKSGFNLADMHSWSAQLQLWNFHHVREIWATALIAFIGMAIIGFIWREGWITSSELFEVRFAATILVALLASPYLYMYDGVTSFLAWIIGYHLLSSHHLSKICHGLLVSFLLSLHLSWIFWPALSKFLGIQASTFSLTCLLLIMVSFSKWVSPHPRQH